MSNLDEFTGRQMLDIIGTVTSQPAYIEQTGGGVATILVGSKEPTDCGIFNTPPLDEHYLLAIGPGTFDWSDSDASTFYAADLVVGADDHGDGQMTVCQTLDEVADAILRHLPVEQALRFIRKGWGGTVDQRVTFLSDPGGFLAYVDADANADGAPFGDEVWAAAIEVIRREWTDRYNHLMARDPAMRTDEDEAYVEAFGDMISEEVQS